MGMFDEVVTTCPQCHSAVTFQTKAGPCILKIYNADELPPEIAADVNLDSTSCEDCGRVVQLAFDDDEPKTVRMIAL